VSAKRLFLQYLSADAVLAFDADNRAARQLASEAIVGQRSGFSLEGRKAAVELRDVVLDARGAHITLDGRRMRSALLGRGHLRNVALALAYARATGVELDTAEAVLDSLSPLRRRMESSAAAGRTILDDTAGHPDSLAAAYEVAGMLAADLAGGRRLLVAYAVRGNRGVDVNRRNARALADLAALHRADRLIVTASADRAGEHDRATPDEIDATRQVLDERGQRYVWHETLTAAMADVAASSAPGDLVVLLGAQGMDAGRELLVAALAAQGPPGPIARPR
jgi:UDP-N-acetylmuramoyl-L-alanyl-D-glutamate--2,6-diaminopimelate ligase